MSCNSTSTKKLTNSGLNGDSNIVIRKLRFVVKANSQVPALK